MNDRRLTSVSTATLFEELTTRVLQLQTDAERPGGIGHLRTLFAEAYETGRCNGIGVQYTDSAQRLQHVLDAATAAMPDVPPASGSPHPAIEYWRTGRQHLWHLVENECKQLTTAAEIQQATAAKRAQALQQRVHAALAPAAPLRKRAGRWLYELGVRISERRDLRGAA